MKKVVLTVTALLAMASPAWATSVVSTDALREWNLIVLGALTSSSEVAGRTFVGGNLSGSSSNYMIKTPAASPTSQPGLTVVGNVTGNTKNLNNGSGAVIGGNVTSGFNLNGPVQTVKVGGTISNTNVNQNTVISGLATSDAYFTSNLTQQKDMLTSSLNDLATSLSQLTPNSTVNIASNRATFVSQPNSSGLAVFNMSSSDLNNFSEIALNVNGADTVVINVSGTNINLNKNFLGGTSGLGEHVIWNFYEATNLSLSTAWGGSILAPHAAAQTSNYVEGSAVFASLQQNGEFHTSSSGYAYNGSYYPPATPPGGDTGGDPGSGGSGGSGGGTPVPEPEAWLILAAGLGLLWAGRRRLSRRG
ncbi:MAG: choice-of-anchor A family protein [Alphaproteobacteria bacterium]|nr:choice-of-anchor A family protein [Alphaproteobacteria bacterium]